MTSFGSQKKKCAICGQENNCYVLFSSNTFGYMDLDTRPAEMMRSTLPYQIEYCQHCHYANGDISKRPSWLKEEDIRSDEYLKIAQNPQIDETAKSFILSAMLHANAHRHEQAGVLYLKAAWAFDDIRTNGSVEKGVNDAVWARTQAALNIEHCAEDNEDDCTMLVDIYRRVGKFDRAKQIAEELLQHDLEDIIRKILQLQISLIMRKDTACHNIGEAVMFARKP